MTQNNWLDLCDEIDDGGWDDGLDQIDRAIASRREVVQRRNARRLIRELSVGDRVMLTNGIKPRFYEGMIGSVIELRDGAAVVNLDHKPSGRGRKPTEGRRQKLLVPFINIVKVDDDFTTPENTNDDDDDDDIGDDNDYEGDDDDDDDDD